MVWGWVAIGAMRGAVSCVRQGDNRCREEGDGWPHEWERELGARLGDSHCGKGVSGRPWGGRTRPRVSGTQPRWQGESSVEARSCRGGGAGWLREVAGLAVVSDSRLWPGVSYMRPGNGCVFTRLVGLYALLNVTCNQLKVSKLAPLIFLIFFKIWYQNFSVKIVKK